MNGNVLAFASLEVLAFTPVAAGAASLLGEVLEGVVAVGVVGSLDSFDGEVPVLGTGGFGVWLYVVVTSVAAAAPGSTSARANKAERTVSQRKRPSDRPPVDCAHTVCGLLEAMTSVRVMPTSRWWCCERVRPSWGLFATALSGNASSLIRRWQAVACLLKLNVYQLSGRRQSLVRSLLERGGAQIQPLTP